MVLVLPAIMMAISFCFIPVTYSTFALKPPCLFQSRQLASRFVKDGRAQITALSSFGGAAEAQFYEGSRLPPPPDIPSLVLSERIVYVALPLVPKVAQLIIAQLLYLDYETAEKPIIMYINSPGAIDDQPKSAITEALAVADVMNYIKSPVSTVCVGQAHGAAAILLANGQKTQRFALPHSSIMIRQPEWGSRTVQASDLAAGAKEAGILRNAVLKFLSQRTENSFDKVYEDIQRSNYMNATEAIAYGIVDKIIYPATDRDNRIKAF